MRNEPSHFPQPDTSQPEENKELKDLHGRLRAVIRLVSRKPKLEVTSQMSMGQIMDALSKGQDPEQQWFRLAQYDKKTKKMVGEYVYIPGRIIESAPEVAFGKAAHEGAHVLITRMGEFVPNEIMQQPGFHAVLAASEERPTDNAVGIEFPGARQWVDAARQDNIESVRKLGEEIQKQRMNIPRFMQLCDLITHERYIDQIREGEYDPEALAVYEKIREMVTRMENTLPSEKAEEKEVLQKAKERFKIVYKEIWPIAEQLMLADITEEQWRQLILMSMNPGNEKLAEALYDGISKLPEEQRKVLMINVLEEIDKLETQQ